jgi:inorganic pyrophosphatase
VELTCLIETPRGSRNKYEWDAERRMVRLDRRLFSSVVYPGDYGLVEGALGDDGRPLDALVLVAEPTFPGCLLPARPVGLFRMRDERGIDDKVICVPLGDGEWSSVTELEHVSASMRDEIAHFFTVYKDLEPKRVTAIEGWASREEAEQEIELARQRLVGGVAPRRHGSRSA